MTLNLRPAHDLPIGELTTLFNRGFRGYLAGHVDWNPNSFARLLALQGIDLWLSRLVCEDEEPLGFGLVNRTADIARLGAMAVVPEGRRRGAASHLLDALLSEARQRGDRLMLLEVFEQNAAALDLYRRHGFVESGRLLGWRLDGLPAGGREGLTSDPIEERPLLEASQPLGSLDYPDLPWQMSRHAAARLAPGARVFGTREVRVVIANPEAELVRFSGLLPAPVEPTVAGRLRSAVAEVILRYPGRRWHAPAFFPEFYGPAVFEPLGFEREPLNQFLMSRRP